MTTTARYYAEEDTTCPRCNGAIFAGDVTTFNGTHEDWVCNAITNPATGPSDIELELEPFGFAWQNEQRRTS